MRRMTLAAAAAVLTSAGAYAAGPAQVFDIAAGASGAEARLERIYFGRVSEDEIRVRVASNGCTDASSFDVNVSEVEDAPGAAPVYAVALTRKAPDTCRRDRSNGVYVSFSKQDLGLPADAAVVIANPVTRDLR